jgi:hypothetical protein
MKPWTLAVAVVAAGVALAPTEPARALDLELSPYGSYLDGDDLGEAWGGGAKLTFSLLEWLAVDARGSYLSYDSGNLEMIPVEATALLRLPLLEDTLVPYGGLGVGYYMFSSGDVELDDEVGFYPVAGVQWNLGEDKRIGVFAEIRWLFLEADVDSATDEFQNLDEADLDGFGVNAGVTFRF